MKTAGRPVNPKQWRRWDIHWWTTSEHGDDEREFVYRTIHDEDGGRLNITEAHRRRWLKPGWTWRLEELRKKQRKQGIPDSRFWPKNHKRRDRD